MGFFYGFKLHLVINEKGEFIALQMTKGNVDDRIPVPCLTKDLMGFIYALIKVILNKIYSLIYTKED